MLYFVFYVISVLLFFPVGLAPLKDSCLLLFGMLVEVPIKRTRLSCLPRAREGRITQTPIIQLLLMFLQCQTLGIHSKGAALVAAFPLLFFEYPDVLNSFFF